MRRKRTRLTPLERRIIAMQYRDRMAVSDICRRHNCVLTTVLSAARFEGVPVPRPRPSQKGVPKRKKVGADQRGRALQK